MHRGRPNLVESPAHIVIVVSNQVVVKIFFFPVAPTLRPNPLPDDLGVLGATRGLPPTSPTGDQVKNLVAGYRESGRKVAGQSGRLRLRLLSRLTQEREKQQRAVTAVAAVMPAVAQSSSERVAGCHPRFNVKRAFGGSSFKSPLSSQHTYETSPQHPTILHCFSFWILRNLTLFSLLDSPYSYIVLFVVIVLAFGFAIFLHGFSLGFSTFLNCLGFCHCLSV
jgi:hypothetical protein